jgi:hypothetical protein
MAGYYPLLGSASSTNFHGGSVVPGGHRQLCESPVPAIGSVVRPDPPSLRQRSNCGCDVSEILLCASSKSLQPVYNWKACYLPTPKNTESISTASARSYAVTGNCRTVSMNDSRCKGPTTVSSCRPLDVCQVSEPLRFHNPIVDPNIVDQGQCHIRYFEESGWPKPMSSR